MLIVPGPRRRVCGCMHAVACVSWPGGCDECTSGGGCWRGGREARTAWRCEGWQPCVSTCWMGSLPRAHMKGGWLMVAWLRIAAGAHRLIPRRLRCADAGQRRFDLI